MAVKLQILDLLGKKDDQFDKDMRHLWGRKHVYKVKTNETLNKRKGRKLGLFIRWLFNPSLKDNILSLPELKSICRQQIKCYSKH